MLSFAETASQLKKAKTVVTGSPVREDILYAKKDASREELGLDSRPLIVSVWGSLGAERMNRVMVDFIRMEAQEDRHNLIHAIGSHGYRWVPEEIAKTGVVLEDHPNIDVRDYIYDMARVLAAADIVLCRAGAATLAELAVMGKPAIIVPSPNVAENHQEKNARVLEKAGGAVVVTEPECSAQKLFETCDALLQDSQRLQEMGRNMRKRAVVDAMDRIYDTVCQAAARHQK